MVSGGLRQLLDYGDVHQHPKNNENKSEEIQKKCKILNKLFAAFAFFIIGAIIELYTFNKTGSISESTGIGWGTFLAFCIMNISN